MTVLVSRAHHSVKKMPPSRAKSAPQVSLVHGTLVVELVVVSGVLWMISRRSRWLDERIPRGSFSGMRVEAGYS